MLLILRSLVYAACLLVVGVDAASAQQAGRLAGVVRDATGSVLPGVTVTVAGPALGAPRTVVTDAHGQYAIDLLPEGRYLVTATLRGFEPLTTEVQVGPGAVTFDIPLAVRVAHRVHSGHETGAADIQSRHRNHRASARTIEQLGSRGRRPRRSRADGDGLTST
jgi:hypothetical protein